MTVATDPRKTGVSAGATLLATSAVAVSVTGTTNETALATVTIPGGAMGLNGGLYILAAITVTNSANNKTLLVKYGGATVRGATVTTAGRTFNAVLRNRGAANSQVSVQVLDGATFVATMAIDSSVTQSLTITGQLALGTETITLESYEVWLLP